MSANNRKTHRIPAKDLIEAPKPAEDQVVGMIARQGLIGQCLYDALQDVIAEDAAAAAATASTAAASSGLGKKNTGTNGDEDVDSTGIDEKELELAWLNDNQPPLVVAHPLPAMRFTQHMADNVMKEFGRAVAGTKWAATSKETSSGWRRKQSKNNKEAPPAALMRGRIDHYNRYQGKWRIVVHSAQFKRRAILPKNRKKNTKALLWDAVGEQENSAPTTLQLLAYDDVP